MRFWISPLTCQNKGNDNWQLSIFFNLDFYQYIMQAGSIEHKSWFLCYAAKTVSDAESGKEGDSCWSAHTDLPL